MTSLQSLQADVLSEIFEWLAVIFPPEQGNYKTTPDMGWVLATHVCRHWRQVALNLGKLWAGVVCSLPNVSSMEEIKKRARSCPLRVFIMNSRTRVARIEFALRNLGQLQSLSCEGSFRWCENVADRGPLLLLRELSIDQEQTDSRTDLRCLCLDAPGMQRMTLKDVILSPCHSSLYPNLRDLSISGQSALPSPSYEILGILSHMKVLEHLQMELFKTGPKRLGQWDKYKGDPVHLVKLRAAKLIGWEGTDVLGLLSKLGAPAQAQVELIVAVEEEDSRILATLYDRMVDPVHDTCVFESSTKGGAVSFVSSDVTPFGHCSKVRVEMRGRSIGGVLLLLVAESPRLEHITRWVLEPTKSIVPFFARNLLKICPSVCEMVINASKPEDFEFLFTRLPGHGSKYSLTCPGLRVLSVRRIPPSARCFEDEQDYVEWWSQFQAAIQRYAALGGRLRQLRLVGEWSWDMPRIRVKDGRAFNYLWNSRLVDDIVEERRWKTEPYS
ncbi:unnamed protein product [Peniophora sp. CBMAI 1063]|nr:unnamed protein product [Peniophora sp. CBMAI 1063]